MSRFVRASKFRHVFGTPTKREACYDNIKVSTTAWDCDLVAVNPRYLAVQWAAGGGGAFATIPLGTLGRLPENYPTYCGHQGAVLDMSWNPFNDSIIATGAEDAKLMVWRVPEEGMEESQTDALVALSGHQRKVGHVLFHPVAESVLLSASADLSIKIWDIQQRTEAFSLEAFTEIPQGLTWNRNGSLVAATCRDHKIRIMDPREQKVVQEADGHPGVKGSRIVWLGGEDYIATTGFSKMSDRQLHAYDLRKFQDPVFFQNLDTSSGVLMPFYDPDTKMLYLAGKGDGNIRYYEWENQRFEFLNEYKSGDPQRGMGWLPKRAVQVNENETARAYKVHRNFIEPIPFKVPRRAETFQADIFPDAIGDEPSLSANDWKSGKNADPKLISLKDGFKPQTAKEFVTTAISPKAAKAETNGSPQGHVPEADYASLKREFEALQNELQAKNLKISQLEQQIADMKAQ